VTLWRNTTYRSFTNIGDEYWWLSTGECQASPAKTIFELILRAVVDQLLSG